MADDVTFRFEVLVGDRWQRCTAETLGVDKEDAETLDWSLVNDHELIGVYHDGLEFARRELDEAVVSFAAARENARMPSPAGLRIVLWEAPSAEGEPDVVIRASHDQLATGRLVIVASGVAAAVDQLRKARERLRAGVLEAATTDHLGRNQIAKAIERTWSRRLILQYLSGYDIIRDIRMALPPDWVRYDGHEHGGYNGEPWEERLGPFWCGPVMLELSSIGQVDLSIVDTADGPHYDASEKEVQAYNAAARQRALQAAEQVHAALYQRGLRMLTKEGEDVAVQELARVPVRVTRRSR
ncbi:hypothetical protein [Virgisporangium aurantiacum]|uniref:Uncharacterized protein n=1 Tax=Virgisporangium aurantiacum TaxID=175570 RepID=A0A8J4EAG0_9ACTN|nr:hypothetical protein [Virgisporangium aurantiacum]GIJ64737.1 hypothetical protein Vau01_122530 [Virgisporangium aurantiacum]